MILSSTQQGLPNELIARVFEFMTVKELCAVASTCRKHAAIVTICSNWSERCMIILKTINERTPDTSKGLPDRVPTRNAGWRPLYFILQRTEIARGKLVPVSTFLARCCVRPIVVLVLWFALFQAALIDIARVLKNRAATYRRLYVITQLTECILCMWLLPTVMCYIALAASYAWNLELPTAVVEETFQDIITSLQCVRDKYTAIPEAVYDSVERTIVQVQSEVYERADMDWKVHKLTAPCHECMTLAVAVDLCLWCSGFQDSKFVQPHRYR